MCRQVCADTHLNAGNTYDVSVMNNGSLRVLHRFHPVLKVFCSLSFAQQWQPFTKQWREEDIQFCNLLNLNLMHSGFLFFSYFL